MVIVVRPILFNQKGSMDDKKKDEGVQDHEDKPAETTVTEGKDDIRNRLLF
jgi:hypothetical protein